MSSGNDDDEGKKRDTFLFLFYFSILSRDKFKEKDM
jgi:hypothetical protein